MVIKLAGSSWQLAVGSWHLAGGSWQFGAVCPLGKWLGLLVAYAVDK